MSIELNISSGQPQFNIVGLPDKALDEAKDRVNAAIENSGFDKRDNSFRSPKSNPQRITVSLAPAELPKSGSIFDLAIAIAYLEAQKELDRTEGTDMFLGELALDSTVQAVRGVLSAAVLAKNKGFKRLFVPKANAKEAALIGGIDVYPVEDLTSLISFLRGDDSALLKEEKTEVAKIKKHRHTRLLLDDVKGQEHAKRALQIAAAGGHNIAFYGPPGTGKSMLAKVFSSLLPDFDEQSVIELTGIYSSAGLLKEGEIVTRPPFRSPHHSSSYVSIVGGGAQIKPGEITLAHKGVLFMDEFPEFDKRVINALREPLEERKITVSRAAGSEIFPANFILIAALNPCPCGYYGSSKCTCSANSIQRYQAKISGPVADRIDIWVSVYEVDYDKLLENGKRVSTEHKNALEKIKAAQQIQKRRFTGNILNAHMSAPALNKYVKLDNSLKKLLNSASERMALSARAYHKVLKVARSIADIENSADIKEEHILEALSYRERIS